MGQSEKDIAQLENKMLTEVEKHGFNPALGMRAALLIARSYICGTGDTPQTDVLVAIDAALDSPPRNCDVGTVYEQAKRFQNVCKKYKLANDACDASCPMQMSLDCELAWSQMEYEEEARQ